MTPIDMQISLDRKDATYGPDETITGEVWVQVNEKNFYCARLLLQHHWHSHRSGHSTKRSERALTLATDVTWQAGLDYRFPFAITAPSEPLTHRGEKFKATHFLRVRAKPAFSTKPKAWTRSPLSQALKADIPFILKIRERHYKLLRVVPIGITWSDLFGYAPFFAFLSVIISGILGAIVGLSPLVLFILLFLFMLGLKYRVYISTFLAELRLEKANTYRKPKVNVNLEVTGAENVLKCRLQIQPKGKIELGSSSIKLTVREEYEQTYYDKDGVETVTKKDIIYEEKAYGHQSQSKSDGLIRTDELMLQLPDDLPTARGLEIIWQVNVKVTLKKWFDWYRSYTLTIS